MSESGNVWAVIVGSSQYWHNYRHVSGALTMYDAVRTLGVPDSQIVLMLAGDMPCDARNAAPGRVVNARLDGPNLYRPDIQVDYRGAEVTAEAFLRVLTDTLPADTPASRRLGSGAGSRVLVYLAGHGGDEFFKFQDLHELASQELADGLAQARSPGPVHLACAMPSPSLPASPCSDCELAPLQGGHVAGGHLSGGKHDATARAGAARRLARVVAARPELLLVRDRPRARGGAERPLLFPPAPLPYVARAAERPRRAPDRRRRRERAVAPAAQLACAARRARCGSARGGSAKGR